VLILDEPTSALQMGSYNDLVELMMQANEKHAMSAHVHFYVAATTPVVDATQGQRLVPIQVGNGTGRLRDVNSRWLESLHPHPLQPGWLLSVQGADSATSD
jgi:energy-coupling factor transporter ATP-binding protein EcfA2